jgi:hypothetical protein
VEASRAAHRSSQSTSAESQAIPKSVVSTQFANLARTWIRLADELERTLAFIDALEEETEAQRRTG